jgi:hypothetical protein
MDPALKYFSISPKDTGKNEDALTLRGRVKRYMSFTHTQEGDIASELKRSPYLIRAWFKEDPVHDYAPLEKDLKTFLDRKTRDGIAFESSSFCLTRDAQIMYSALTFARQNCEMCAIVGASGSGKSETGLQVTRDYPETIYYVANPTTAAKGSVLALLSRPLHGVYRGEATNAVLLERIVENLVGSRRFLIFDESHFLSWEGLECVRTIHDRARVGIALLGQETLIAQMRGGRRAQLYDQIFSRLGIRVHLRSDATREDVAMLVNGIHPEGLDKKALEFLHYKACAGGKFRTMCKILKTAHNLAIEKQIKVDLELLRKVSEHLML